ncbi:MAG: hypothetical protein K2G26_06460, partial [Clostridia bacterium]|nr:hypothetical protein [Clostridia bacterium]
MRVASVTEEYINAPANLSTTYDGNNHWINSFSDSWIKNYHSDENAVVVNSINYVPPVGSTTGQAESLGTDTSNLKKAGTYTVNMGLAKDLNRRWSDGTTSNKTFNINVGQMPSVVTVTNPYSAPTYLPDELPTLTNTASNGTPGTFSWKAQQPQEGAHEYTWYFTPDDDVNYAPKEGKLTFDYLGDSILSIEVKKFNENNKTIFTNTPLTTLKSYFEVVATYASMGSGDEPRPLTSFIVQIDDNNGKLVGGSNNVTIFTNDYSKSTSYTIKNVQELEYTQIITLTFSQTTFTYPVTAEEIRDKIALFKVKRNDEQTVDVDKSETTVEGDLTAGTKTLTLKLGDLTKTFSVTINKGDYNIPDSVFEDKKVTYTGEAFDPEGWIDTSKLPAGMTVSYSCDGDMTEVNESGYTVTATFSNPDPDNYNNPAPKTAKLIISDKPTYNMDGVTFEDKEVVYNGQSQSIAISGTLPDGVTVKYY